MNRLNREVVLVKKGRAVEADGWTALGVRIDGPRQLTVYLGSS